MAPPVVYHGWTARGRGISRVIPWIARIAGIRRWPASRKRAGHATARAGTNAPSSLPHHPPDPPRARGRVLFGLLVVGRLRRAGVDRAPPRLVRSDPRALRGAERRVRGAVGPRPRRPGAAHR